MPNRSTERVPGLRGFGSAPVLLIFFVAVVWPYSLFGPFQFDDWNVIVDAPAVHSVSAWWQSMPGIRPLLKLSYALNWRVSEHPGSFHGVNILLHAANVWLVWKLMALWPGLGRSAAWWVALIFALHPVQTEAVTYISGRSMSLMSCFWLAAALCWLRQQRVASLLLFVAALATRETAWSLPFVLLLWHRAQGFSWRDSVKMLWSMWMMLALLALIILLQPNYQRMLSQALDTRGPVSNLALQIHVLSYFLFDALVLLRNNIDPVLPSAARFDATWWIGAMLVVTCLYLGLRNLQRHPPLGLALLWPFILLLPTNGLIARLDPASERHLYLAMLGPVVLLVHLVTRTEQRKSAMLSMPRMSSMFLSALCVSLAAATMMRIHDYRSEPALWEATRLRSPGKPRVWNNLGYAYLMEGRPERAKPAFERALALDADFLRARLNLARAEDALAKSDNASVAAPLKDQ